MNQTCYRFEKIQYSDGLLSKNVDATYIIHLANNGRKDDIINQLQQYHPTNIVYIVYNKGYKNCTKHDSIKNTARDLVDVNIQIFKHAENQNYNNILILEDDFTFSPKIKEEPHLENIHAFLTENENRPFIYLLGCVPTLLFPHDYNNYKAINAIGMHCVIFNKSMRTIVLEIEQSDIDDWDTYFILYFLHHKYTYYIPLCYQLFPETENSKGWGGDNFLFKIYCRMGFLLFSALKMNTQVEPGYSILYIFSKLLTIAVIMVILYVIVKYLVLGQRRNR
jgi:hypothetical protein